MTSSVQNPTAAQSILNDPNTMDFAKKTGLGGLIGMIVGSPLLGAAGGALYALFSKGGGMPEGMSSVLNQVGDRFGVDLSDPKAAVQTLGKRIFGDGTQEAPSREANHQAANAAYDKGQTTSGFKIPGWLKIGGIALAGMVGLDLFSSMFQNMAYGGGPLGVLGGFDPTMGMGMAMDPTMAFSSPWYNGFSGGLLNNPLTNLLLLGGGAFAISKLASRKSE